jgi:hypothetical protein
MERSQNAKIAGLVGIGFLIWWFADKYKDPGFWLQEDNLYRDGGLGMQRYPSSAGYKHTVEATYGHNGFGRVAFGNEHIGPRGGTEYLV